MAMPVFVQSNAEAQRRWLITFSDLISLLLAFFVMLFAMSSVDRGPWDEMTNALMVRLNPEEAWQITAAMTDRDVYTEAAPEATDLDYLRSVVAEKIRGVPALDQATIERRDDRLIITLQTDALFTSGSDTLTDEAQDALGAVGETLRHVRNRVDVNGHTDPGIARGGRWPSNWELSIHRALAVAEALRRSGYTQEIAAIGLAESRFDELPADLPEDERFRRARRVDVVIRETYASAANHGS